MRGCGHEPSEKGGLYRHGERRHTLCGGVESTRLNLQWRTYVGRDSPLLPVTLLYLCPFLLCPNPLPGTSKSLGGSLDPRTLEGTHHLNGDRSSTPNINQSHPVSGLSPSVWTVCVFRGPGSSRVQSPQTTDSGTPDGWCTMRDPFSGRSIDSIGEDDD